MLTFPHFLDTSEEYTNLVEGLNPDPELHETMVIMEPNTGNPLVGHKRAQINMFIRHIPGVDMTASIKTALVPIVWIDEGILLNDDMVGLLKSTLINRLILVDVLHWVLFAGGLAFFIVFFTWHCCTKGNKK